MSTMSLLAGFIPRPARGKNMTVDQIIRWIKHSYLFQILQLYQMNMNIAAIIIHL